MAVHTPTSTGGSSQTATSEESKLPVPSRNPLPLSASQEAQVRDVFYARVRRSCADEIKAFAECAMNRTFSVAFVCRSQHRVMNACMKSHATPAEQDAAREEWFAQRLERQRERERKARKKLSQEEFLREWWGLPEKDEELRRREEEKLRRGERVGGWAARNRERWEDPSPTTTSSAGAKPGDQDGRP
ncbi:hypothetical protein SODALDRAFT_331819 [Sodiomyces alkalinus F11]|uniref:COX assembly mitochondrial protein n=1 Tax=Sodiomyces alkalinus (strain CBS 110278 / VKM F-3762 / F11) TaxID=1314773 RepID=A0A3N2PZ60_SODAK|nr:hypothetical protein SODALDRAFT_331819 [Sodiomyces alkalinus F11]ROT39708.1 hypothetical protein SODALDRAFT_331819 [Sodiomyces alkalinus F11]